MSNGQVDVNKLRASSEAGLPLICSLGTDKLYRPSLVNHVKKDEVNIVIEASNQKGLLLRGIPLFDDQDISNFRKTSKTAKFLHLGAVTISLQSLFHHRFIENFGSKFSGFLALVDTTFHEFEHSIIAMQRFDLSKPRSDLVSFPNHCLSLTDPHLLKRLSVLIAIDQLPVAAGTELFNLCLGAVTTTTNTLNPSNIEGAENISITNATQPSIEEIPELLKQQFQSALTTAFQAEAAHTFLNGGDDEYLKDGKRGFLRASRPAIRRKKFRALPPPPLTGLPLRPPDSDSDHSASSRGTTFTRQSERPLYQSDVLSGARPTYPNQSAPGFAD